MQHTFSGLKKKGFMARPMMRTPIATHTRWLTSTWIDLPKHIARSVTERVESTSTEVAPWPYQYHTTDIITLIAAGGLGKKHGYLQDRSAFVSTSFTTTT